MKIKNSGPFNLGPNAFGGFMKWLMILFTLFNKHFFSSSGESTINPVEEIKSFLQENAVKVLLVFILSTIMSSLFVAGVVITVVGASSLYDQNLPIVFNAMITSGLVISVLSLSTITIIYKSFTKDKKTVKTQATHVAHPTALQESLLLLVNDFVKEREFNRTTNHQRKAKQEATQQFDPINDADELASLDKH